MPSPKRPRDQHDLVLYDDSQPILGTIRTLLCLAANTKDRHDEAAKRLPGAPTEVYLLQTTNDLLTESLDLVYEQVENAEDLIRYWWEQKDHTAPMSGRASTPATQTPAGERIAPVNGQPH